MKTMLLAMLVLAGCAPSTEYVWVKNGANIQDFNVDSGQCKAQALSAPEMPAPGMPAPGMPAPGMPAPGMPAPGMPDPGMPMMQKEIIYSNCMQGKGWYKEERTMNK